MSPTLAQSIRERAYAIWEREGRPPGRSLAHWLQADEEAVRAGPTAVTDDGKPVKAPGAGRSRSNGARSD